MSDSIDLMPLPELRGKGLQALISTLGPANALRFLAAFGGGAGDYTKDRDAWLKGVTLEQVEQELAKKGSSGG